MRHGFGAIAVAMLALALNGTSALACETYTFSDEEDWFGLSRGVQWAFTGTVDQAIPNPELPDKPTGMVLHVRETIAGSPVASTLTVAQDAGCDGFWYEPGDRIVAAVGRQRNGPQPPFDGITNYSVAVWGIRDGRVSALDRLHGQVLIDDVIPTTELQLKRLLAALPATDTPPPAPDDPMQRPMAMLGLLMASGVAAWLANRTLSRRRFPN